MKILILNLVIIFSIQGVYGQIEIENKLAKSLDSLSQTQIGLNNTVQLNISQLPLVDFVNSIALENNLNISIDPSLNWLVNYNFYDARVKDILVFISKNFEVDFQFLGTIISITKRPVPIIEKILKPVKEVDVKYQRENDFLSVNLKSDSLWKVKERITQLTGRNIVISSEIRNKPMYGFFQNRPFSEILQMIAKENDLDYKVDESRIIYFTKAQKPAQTTKPQQVGITRDFIDTSKISIERTEFNRISIRTNNAELEQIIRAAAKELGVPYYLYSKLEGVFSFKLENVDFEQFLGRTLNATKYGYKLDEKTYLIGDVLLEGIRSTKVIRMENRTIENVLGSIPSGLLNGLEVKEFLELNALIVSGGQRKINELSMYLRSIDVVVPMIQIDVMILFSQSGFTREVGIKAGLKNEPTITQGEIFPEYNLESGSASINNLLSALNGFGIVNLGKVTANFYTSLKVLESNNIISVESTPKITTLNGHLARMSIGETTSYQETQLQVNNSINNLGTTQTSRIYKTLEANLALTITPFVSADEFTTLTILVEQKDFGARVDPSAPPNLTTQTFESMVRIKNGEVILLGGLEKKKKNESGSGVPFLSKIPILKWFFSNRKKEKEKSKLHILIRPTIVY